MRPTSLPAGESAVTGRTKISLFTLLGGTVLIAFSIIIGANLWSQYRLSNQIIDQNLGNSVDQNQALFKTVINARLELITSGLTMLLQQEELRSLDKGDSLSSIEARLLTLIEDQNQSYTADFIILSGPQGSECRNSLEPFFSAALDCASLIQQFDSNLYSWHLAKLDTQELPLLVLLTRAPLIASDGLVLGYLYAGTILTQNFSLLNQVISANPEHTVAVGISYQDQLIASSARPMSPEHRALVRAVEQPGQLFKFKQDDIASMSRNLAFEHHGDIEVGLVSVIYTDAQLRLQRGMIKQTSWVLLQAIVFAILIVFLTLKLALTPLHRLRRLAARRHHSDQTSFNPGPITEFQQLSFDVAAMLTELQINEQKLTENGHLLQSSHQEQQLLISRNRKLLQQLFNLQEQERKNLAQELHDELGQPLAVINTDSYLIKQAFTAGESLYICADSIHQNSKEMADVVYKRILSLRPMPLNDLGLFEAIRHMPALGNLEKHGIYVATELPSKPEALPDAVSIHIFRIIQEGLTNILKHSHADRAWLRLQLLSSEQHPQRLVLEIVDNGIGFDQQLLKQSPGYGLSGIVERVHAMGGALELLRDPQQNFCIRISIDLTQEPAEEPLEPFNNTGAE